MDKQRVTYVTCVPLDTEFNGGARCCRNHLRRLAEDDGIDLHAILIAEPHAAPGARAVLDQFGVRGDVVVRNMNTCSPEGLGLLDAARFGARMVFRHHWELEAMHQGAVDARISDLLADWDTEVVVFDYLFSCLFAPTTMTSDGVKKVIITLNREGEFNQEMADAGVLAQHPLIARHSSSRLKKTESNLYRQADLVVAIGRDDIPKGRHIQGTCITPYFDADEHPWQYSANEANNVLFVGNIAHFPNRLAMQWIAEHLAPAVEALRSDVRFLIVGASADEVPASWRHKSIDYLGFSDKETVDRLFRSCGLSICPVQNTFGMKFKLAEALACGIPILVSAESARCAPYATSVLSFPLSAPREAAALIARNAGSQELLTKQSELQLTEHRDYILTQANIWSRTFEPLTGRHVAPEPR